MKKRILYVHHVSSVGGASFCLLNVIKAVDRERYEPIVLLKNIGPLSIELEKIGVEVLYLPSLSAIPYNKSLFSIRSCVNYAKVLLSLREFKSIIKRNHIDIIYLNNMMLYPYLYVSNDFLTIVHVREHWPLDEHRSQLRVAQRALYKYASKVIAINGYSSKMFAECSFKTTIIHDWISFNERFDGPTLKEVINEEPNGKKVYLFTGGLHWTKGTLEVVDTFTSFIKDKNSRLLILGVDKKKNNLSTYSLKRFFRLGRKNYRQTVEQLISSDDRILIAPSIYKLGRILKDAYCNLSFFTIPHANLTLAESIILGTPTIAAETDESIEYSDSGNLAVLYEYKSKEAFKDAIVYLNDNYETIKLKIENNAARVKQMFSPENNIALLNQVYESLSK